jgi:hypothetical protein
MFARTRDRTRARRAAATLVLLAVAACAGTLDGRAASATSQDPAGSEPAPLFLIGDGRVPESSGIALSRRHRLVWVHNDAGNEPVIYGIRPTGATQTRITLDGAAGEDWEDIAVATVDGRDWIYLDDVGDAYQVRRASGLTYRRQYEIVRFAEPDAVVQDTDVRVTAEVFPVEFEDQEGVNVEAMAVRESGAIILVEKVEPDGDTSGQLARVWQIERPVRDRPNVPVEVARIPVVGASAADISVDGTTMALRDAGAALMYDLRRGLDDAFDAPVRQHPLPEQDQGEGVAFTLDDQGLVLSGEGRAVAVWFVPLIAGAEPVFGPLPLAVTASNRAVPERRRATVSGWDWKTWLLWSLPVMIGGLTLVGPVMWWRRRAGKDGR